MSDLEEDAQPEDDGADDGNDQRPIIELFVKV